MCNRSILELSQSVKMSPIMWQLFITLFIPFVCLCIFRFAQSSVILFIRRTLKSKYKTAEFFTLEHNSTHFQMGQSESAWRNFAWTSLLRLIRWFVGHKTIYALNWCRIICNHLFCQSQLYHICYASAKCLAIKSHFRPFFYYNCWHINKLIVVNVSSRAYSMLDLLGV